MNMLRFYSVFWLLACLLRSLLCGGDFVRGAGGRGFFERG